MAKMKLAVENVKKLKSHVQEDYFMKIQNVCQCHMFVMVSKVTLLALYPLIDRGLQSILLQSNIVLRL